jgi:hypothetical protein
VVWDNGAMGQQRNKEWLLLKVLTRHTNAEKGDIRTKVGKWIGFN